MFIGAIRRKFERTDYQLENVNWISSFLNTCHKCNVTPNFLLFRITYKKLKDSATYLRWQQLLSGNLI